MRRTRSTIARVWSATSQYCDDVKLLYKYVGVDVIGAFLREVAPSDRALAAQHLLAVMPLLINKDERDEIVRDDQVFVTEGELDRYRQRLMRENPALLQADFSADHCQGRLGDSSRGVN
ncbi:hypothetical protein ASE14_01715 [Agromyces sp. Root81]|uniref:hypothetical protein n=1 Tax=Agromyces sp. Root81 TaxID=1736601 RepID=UPI0006F86003|nr:hypothetical protein [Agromyces sp. Root81]KRC62572.1 hypothetical protein ASE14_01715 [Agromyces sp. Root81]